MSIITNKEIYDESQGDPFKSITAALEILNKKIEETKKEMLSLEKAINQGQGDSGQVKELTINIQKLESEIEKLKNTEAAKNNIQKQLNAAQEKYRQILAGEQDELIKTRVEVQALAQKKMVAAKVASDTTNQTIKYRLELRQLKSTLLTAQKGTEDYNKAMQRAAYITDELADMQEFVKGTAMDLGGVMGNVHKVTTGVASGFEIAQGMAALFGKENEDLAKALVKVQATMAIAQGLQGLDGFGKAIQRLLFQMKIFAQGVNKAFAFTVIGLFVAALTALALMWDRIREKVSGVSNELRRATEIANQKYNIAKKEYDVMNMQDNILKLQGKSQKEILQLKLKETKEMIMASLINLELEKRKRAAALEGTKKNKEWLKSALDYVAGGIGAILQAVDWIGKAIGKDWNLKEDFKNWTSNLLFDADEAKEENQAYIDEQEKAIVELRDLAAGYQLEIKELDKKGSEDKIKNKQDEIDKLKEIEQGYFDNLREKSEQDFNERTEKAKILEEEEQASMDKAREEFNKTISNQIEKEAEAAKKAEELEIRKRELIGETLSIASEAFAKMLADGTISYREFGKLILMTALDVAERMIQLALVEIFAKEIASKSFAGLVTGPILMALVKGLFAGIKSRIQSFAEGTEYVNGPGTGKSDSIPANLSKGERIVPADVNKQLLGIGNKDLPYLVNKGLSLIRTEQILNDINRNSKETALMLSNGKNIWDKGRWFYVQDWKTGAINRKLKNLDD
jgi:hypothetical protein